MNDLLTDKGAGIISLVFLCLALPASAEVLDEIVVTAQKRDQNIQDVGIAVTALTGEQLRNLGMTSTVDIDSQVPGLLFLEGSEQLISITNIRGVSQNDVSFHLEPPNAVYVDQAYVSFLSAANMQMFDLRHVEVLRGPQGTLFGRNATGGLLHYISNVPTDHNEGYVDLLAGENSQFRFEGAASGPLGESVAARLAAVYSSIDDFASNTTTGGGIRGRDEYGLRGQLLFEPSDAVDIRLIGSYTDLDTNLGYKHSANGFDADGLEFSLPAAVNFYGNCPGCDPSGHRDSSADPYVSEFETQGFYEADSASLTGVVNWEFGDSKLTSVTNYLRFDAEHLEDGELAPRPGFNLNSIQDSDQFSQEIRLSGVADRLLWITGVYYLSRDATSGEDVNVSLAYLDDVFTVFGLAPPGFLSSLGTTDNLLSVWSLDTTSWAVFGQLEYDIAGDWTVVAGLRWNDDSHDYSFVSTESIDGFPLGPGGILGETSAIRAKDESDWSGKAGLEWRPSDDVMAYASYSRGIKSGGFNAPFLGGEVTDFGSETLNSIEFGVKSLLFGSNARLNVAAFYYDYADYQGFTFVNLAPQISNMDAKVTGLEAEFYATPGEGWDIGLGLSLLDTTIEAVVLPATRVADRSLPLAPEISVNGLIRKSWLAFGGTLALMGDVVYTDEYFSEALNNPSGLVDSRVIGNARLTFTSADERWEIGLMVRNIGDEEILNYRTPTGFGFNQDHYGRPRWVSGQFGYRWN